MNKWNERLARQLIEDNGHLESFLVDLSGIAELNDVALSLRAQGCKVAINLIKNRLNITPRVASAV